MSLKSLSEKMQPRGKSVADALGGKVGNLQAMLQAIKKVSREKAPAVLEALFGLDPENAKELVDLLRADSKNGMYQPIVEQIRERTGKSAQENQEKHRARGENPSKAMAKVIKKAASLCDRLDDLDREKALQVLRECMEATTPYFNKETEKTEERIDARMRLAAVTLLLAYDEGLPVQRVLTGRVEQETADEIMSRLRESPAAMAALRAARNAGATLTIGGEIVDIDAEVLPVEPVENRD
jgi:hypothetical protein